MADEKRLLEQGAEDSGSLVIADTDMFSTNNPTTLNNKHLTETANSTPNSGTPRGDK